MLWPKFKIFAAVSNPLAFLLGTSGRSYHFTSVSIFFDLTENVCHCSGDWWGTTGLHKRSSRNGSYVM